MAWLFATSSLWKGKAKKLTPIKIDNGKCEFTEFFLTDYDQEQFESLKDYFEQDIKPFFASIDYKEQLLVITTKVAQYSFDPDKETLLVMYLPINASMAWLFATSSLWKGIIS
jgi:hypothetical protein